jgi:hypothetical protein
MAIIDLALAVGLMTAVYGFTKENSSAAATAP